MNVTVAKIESNLLPGHIAIIMDGNGRWATARSLPRIAGHKKGADSLRGAIKACIEKEIPYLTVYAFSSENWKRPVDEVDGLMQLLRFYLGKELADMHKNDICIRIIGDKSLLTDEIKKLIESAEMLTKDNKTMTLTIALSYGSRQEILSAVKNVAVDIAANKVDNDSVDENYLTEALYTSGLPDPDLLIRTGGEKRLSNFLLWQLAYTELYFSDILWPDFTKSHMLEAIEAFAKRERRYGNS